MRNVPGIDARNYQGDEIGLLMHGIMPFDVDLKVKSAKFEINN